MMIFKLIFGILIGIIHGMHWSLLAFLAFNTLLLQLIDTEPYFAISDLLAVANILIGQPFKLGLALLLI